jgi:hypothetical protein
MCGGIRCTSLEAIKRFFAAVSATETEQGRHGKQGRKKAATTGAGAAQ